MALGLVADDEFEQELNRLSSPASATTAIVVGRKEGGRGDAIPEPIKKVIAECSIMGDNQADVARAFNVTQASVSQFSQGFTTSNLDTRQVNQELTKHVNIVREKITAKATNRLKMALNAITPDKVRDLSANKAGQLAKDMAAIVREMEPPSDNQNLNNGVQIIFQAPRERRLDEFEIIQASHE